MTRKTLQGPIPILMGCGLLASFVAWLICYFVFFFFDVQEFFFRHLGFSHSGFHAVIILGSLIALGLIATTLGAFLEYLANVLVPRELESGSVGVSSISGSCSIGPRLADHYWSGDCTRPDQNTAVPFLDASTSDLVTRHVSEAIPRLRFRL
jgi:hypothetical protein